jgi:hypothetical protein
MRFRQPRAVMCSAALSLALLCVVVPACSDDDKPSAAPAPTTTSTTSTSTTTTSTTTTVPAGPVAPLTGLPAPADRQSALLRPALGIKVDNHPDAIPQQGLNAADIVIEEKVEGISRLLTVFQSNDSAVGPVRSARFSDPDLLGLFGVPLFGWSGANDAVSSDVARAPWVINVNWDRFPGGYARRGVHAAPHNLYTNTATLYGKTQPGQAPPPTQFTYLGVGQSNAGATPAPGASLRVGDTPSEWDWDPATSGWLRWEYGRRHSTEDAGQVNAANVVILETRYTGGSLTPTAVSVGGGQAWVLTGGSLVAGTWIRSGRNTTYSLIGTDGQPIKLASGRTWIELPSTGNPPAVFGADRAAQLTAG